MRILFCELLTRIRHDKPLSVERVAIRSMTFIGKIGCEKYGQNSIGDLATQQSHKKTDLIQRA